VKKPPVHDFSPEELVELREAFSLFDTDGSGSIDASELKRVLGCLGRKLTTEELVEIISSIDQDGNGQIEFDEFKTLMASYWTDALDSDEDIVEAFKAFDIDNKGYITSEKFREFFRKLELDLQEGEIEEMIAQIDTNHDGVIDYVEFTRMLRDPTMGGPMAARNPS